MLLSKKGGDKGKVKENGPNLLRPMVEVMEELPKSVKAETLKTGVDS